MTDRFTLILSAAVASTLCLAQPVTVDVRIAARAGDTVRLRMAKIRDDANRPQSKGRSETPVEIKVMQAAPSGLVVSWKYGATRIDRELTPAEKSILEASSQMLAKLKLEVSLDRSGAYRGLKNEADVSQVMAALIESTLEFMRMGAPDQQKWKQLEPAIRQALSGPNQLMMITRDVQSYFGWYGARLAAGTAAASTVRLPFPLGSGQVPATIRTKLEQADADKAVLTNSTEYDGGVLRAMTLQFFTQILPQATAEQRKLLPSLATSEEGRAVYDRRSGWMDEVVVTRRMSLADKVKRSDVWEFRRE